jgi:hypothetical protein
LRFTKEIKRELDEVLDRANWYVHMGRAGATFRRKGSPKRTPTVPWAKVWTMAMRMQAEEIRLAKIAKRKAKGVTK